MTLQQVQQALLDYDQQMQTTIQASLQAATSAQSVITDLRGQIASLQQQNADLLSPSGQAMRVPIDPLWKPVHAEDFLKTCAEGSFLTTYPAMRAYPIGYTDTSKRGQYDPSIMSVSNSVMSKRLHTDAAGVHHVCALVPPIDPTSTDKWGAAASANITFRMRADVMPTYKLAWMLWPSSNNGIRDGEIDFLEGNFNGNTTVFMHRQDAVKPGDQAVYAIPVSIHEWHTYNVQWIAGQSLTVSVDGTTLFTETSLVPATPMRCILQTETGLLGDTPTISPTVTGLVQLDWIVVQRLV